MPKNIIYSVRGEGADDESSFSLWIPDATTEALTIEFAQEYAALSDAIIGGVIENAQYFAPGTFAAQVADPFSDREEIAVFECICADGSQTVITVPAISEAAVDANRNLIGAGWDDVRAAILSGVGGVSPCGVSGSDIVSIKAEYAGYRASGSR